MIVFLLNCHLEVNVEATLVEAHKLEAEPHLTPECAKMLLQEKELEDLVAGLGTTTHPHVPLAECYNPNPLHMSAKSDAAMALCTP